PGYLDRDAQAALLDDILAVLRAAPPFTPRMPRTGKPFSVRMSNCGPLGWVSDAERGYRYQPTHPDHGAPWPPLPPARLAARTRPTPPATGAPWPPMPPALLDAWRTLSGYPPPPEACLVNLYA